MITIRRLCVKCGRFFQTENQAKDFCSGRCRERSRKPPPTEKDCVFCGAKFSARHKRQKYCSSKCGSKANQRPPVFEAALPGIPSGSSGAAFELIVCADLVLRGLNVFRSVSPSCPCDLIVQRNREIFRVEVTKGGIKHDGSFAWAAHDPEKYDVLALVLPGLKVVYIPDIFRCTK